MKEFIPHGQGNFLYCSDACKIIVEPRLRSNSITGISASKRGRSTSVSNDQGALASMSREDLLVLVKDLNEEKDALAQEKECLIIHTKQIENELTSIKIKIADKFLDKFFNNEQSTKYEANGVSGSQGKSYAAAASKSVTIVAKLNPEVDSSNLNSENMDKFFRSKSDYPTLQSFSKKDNVARFKFNNEADAKKAKQLIEADTTIKASVKSVTERKVEYPIAVFGTGIENLEELKEEMEYRNVVLRDKISRIKILSRKKGHVKIYVTSKKCEEAVIQARKISIKNAKGEFKEHRVEKAKLDFEVTYCFKCKKPGHVAFNCQDKSTTETCGRCCESHKTGDCTHPDSMLKCASCKGPHKSGDFKCPVHVKAVERLTVLLA